MCPLWSIDGPIFDLYRNRSPESTGQEDFIEWPLGWRNRHELSDVTYEKDNTYMTPVGFSMLPCEKRVFLVMFTIDIQVFSQTVSRMSRVLELVQVGNRPQPPLFIEITKFDRQSIFLVMYPRISRFWLVLNFHVSLWLLIACKFPKHPSILIGDRCPCFLVKFPYFDAFPKCWW